MRNNYALDKNDEYNLVIQIVCEKFEQLYPIVTQPAWLKYCLSMRVAKNDAQNWVVQMRLRPKYTLRPNECWAWDNDGIPLLVHVNPATGKETIVICGAAPVDDVVFFEVEIDSANDTATVHVNCDLNSFNGKHYKMNGLFE